MNGLDAAALRSIVRAAWPSTRTDTLDLWGARLIHLPAASTLEAVLQIVDTDTTGRAPSIGRVIALSRELAGTAAANAEATARATLPAGPRRKGRPSPWYVRLQSARREAGSPAGHPLAELLEEGGTEALAVEAREVDRRAKDGARPIAPELEAWLRSEAGAILQQDRRELDGEGEGIEWVERFGFVRTAHGERCDGFLIVGGEAAIRRDPDGTRHLVAAAPVYGRCPDCRAPGMDDEHEEAAQA